MSGMWKRWIVLGVCALALLAGTPGSAAAESKKVSVGVVAPIGLFWPNFVAQRRGFFEKEGVQTDLNFVGEVAAEVQQVIGGSLDVAYTTCEVAVRAVEKGADVRIVGETVRVYPYSIMSAKDVKTAADMKGKKIILAAKNDLLSASWQHWVRDQGGDPKDIDEVYDGATPNRYSALANGAVSAALVSQPFDFRAKSEGYFELMNYSTYLNDYAFVCAAARGDWGKQNPAARQGLFPRHGQRDGVALRPREQGGRHQRAGGGLQAGSRPDHQELRLLLRPDPSLQQGSGRRARRHEEAAGCAQGEPRHQS